MTIQDVRVAHHGREVHGKLYLPQGEGPFAAVLYSHGYNGCMTDFDASARFLAQAGIASLCYTFCGGSTRDTSGYPTTEMTLLTEREDALALLDYLRGLPQVKQESIYLFGGSMGGMVSALAAAQRPEQIAGLLLLFPALGIPQNWLERFPRVEDIPESVEFWGLRLGRVFFTAMRELDAFGLLPDYQGPVQIFQGDQDQVVQVASSERAAALYPHAALEIFPGEGHGFTPEGNARVDEMTLAFILEKESKKA